MEEKFDVIEQFLQESISKFESDGFDRSLITIHIPFYIQSIFARWIMRESNIRCQLADFTYQGVRVEDNYLNVIAVSVKYALTKTKYQPLILNL